MSWLQQGQIFAIELQVDQAETNVLRYLKSTIDQSLIFKKSHKTLKLEEFYVADWANLSDRKSVNGYYFRLTKDNSIISWKSKKLSSVVLSMCEAESIGFWDINGLPNPGQKTK